MLKSSAVVTLFSLLLLSCGGDDVNAPEAEKISHRGYNENRLDGFVAAINDGFKFIETDIRIREGKPILLHDDVECSDCTHLAELLALAQNNDVTLFLEFKESEAIDVSLQIISQYNVDVVLSSFKVSDLVYINSISDYSLAFITSSYYDLANLPSIDYLIINQVNIDKCVATIKCVAWTIHNGIQYYDVMYKVDYVMVDHYRSIP
ncbi:glycerophosphodiester phosphodiesterase [Colwellia hornerae]|uniref:Glycerophosphodiester phosphodiesterase n=1 Tax=Colwellia hornerae TaxID=89402 RepID=A0A5C6QV32_9GAMM|nr:glycerophosphodiester phosphodiesterase [Colwellia hornerae]TWX56955.1 glycerophosphodiester phosphodiesterase [Colwellia hornerae]TWX62320.1 glycerophosphodiester phosphodiesterase [Colwellia hornerae]TWX72348.1 glycerophosphodiester phosphodiesterase [Colwellia hornerae]